VVELELRLERVGSLIVDPDDDADEGEERWLRIRDRQFKNASPPWK
jgi:hypothetical protein